MPAAPAIPMDQRTGSRRERIRWWREHAEGRRAQAPGAWAALISLLAGAALVLAASGSASSGSLPSLYFNYNSSCHFTASTDSGASVGPGTAIPFGTYQVVVNTPFPFSNGQGSCDFVNFQLTGPGVSYTTQLGQGDADQELTSQTFQASGSYTASDSTVAPGTTLVVQYVGVAGERGRRIRVDSGTGRGSSGLVWELGARSRRSVRPPRRARRSGRPARHRQHRRKGQAHVQA